MIKQGDRKIAQIYNGDKRISQIYGGGRLVYRLSANSPLISGIPSYKANGTLAGKFTDGSTSVDWRCSLGDLDVDSITNIFDTSNYPKNTAYCENLFKGNTKLEFIYNAQLSYAQSLVDAFNGCSNLKYVSMYCGALKYTDNLFKDCINLEHLIFNEWQDAYATKHPNAFANCLSLWHVDFTAQKNTAIYNSISFGDSPLTLTSARNIIKYLAQLDSSTSTLTLNKWTYDQLSQEDIALATSKRWNIDYIINNDIKIPAWYQNGNEEEPDQPIEPDVPEVGEIRGTKLSTFDVNAVVLYDSKTSQFIPVDITNGSEVFKMTPIGIVTSSSAENVFGDGKCSVMALKTLSYVTPENGCLAERTERTYYGSTADQIGSVWSEKTAVNDFDTVKQNATILSYNPGYDWKTEDIQNVTTRYNYPAFYCAWRYKTIGTNQGDWCVPAGGELYNMGKNWGTIVNILNILSENGIECMNLNNVDRLYSCSEIRYDQIVSMQSNGTLSVYKKSDLCFTIPFTRI